MDKCDPKAISDRLSRITGQIQAIEKMYAEKRPAQHILQQVVAARASLSSLARTILEAEVKGCLPAAQDTATVSQLVDTLFRVT